MSNLFDYSQTPASNNSTPPDGAPEGMAPSAVNNTMRQMMSAGAGAFNVYTAGGTANAQTVTMDPTLAAYSTKVRIAFIPVANNTGACTLNVNALGVKSIKMPDGTDPPADALDSSGVALVQYNGTNFILLAVANIITTNSTSTLTNKTLTSPDINGGTIDGATIGGGTPASGTFLNLTATNSEIVVKDPNSTGTTASQATVSLKDQTDSEIGYMGFGSPSSSDFTIANTSGNINLISSGGAVQANSNNILVSGGALGTPSSGTLTNCTGLPVAGISGYESSSYTGTAVGLTTSPTGTVYYVRIGNKVTLSIPTISGTTDAGAFQISGAPASIRPTATTGRQVVYVTSGSASALGTVKMLTSGTLEFGVGGDEDDFSTGSGSLAFQFTYNLNQS